MDTKCSMLFATLAAGSIAAFTVAAGQDLATSSPYGGFGMNTCLPRVVSTLEEVGDIAVIPVAYRAGDTVTVTSPNGDVVKLKESAGADGNVSFAPTADGVWRFANSRGETASICVGWGVFASNWQVDFSSASPFRMHTDESGPNRKVHILEIPPVSYSGDGWMGSVDKASVLTLTAPSGASTRIDLTGAGARQFAFDETGTWTVRLEMQADGSVLESSVNVVGGFVLVVR